ncbi:MAG: uncharacterized protein PWP39_829 [Pyrococcus sp.]|uniref:DUF2334 domain-containing protein n=1 Tax=Pyrococcus sp. TaxID=33866 RepID=UPI00258814D5|nr:DUF2334 domain-containing protein [Pyrococcus sp.]MDK2869594.1 uncharacterized protein [Pyrococcus sp.]
MKAKVLLLIILAFFLSSSLTTPTYFSELGKFVILVHDVSPAYISQIERLASIINEYGLQEKTYLFVIPNHGGGMPIEKDKRFMDLLENLSSWGYHIELHGYTHVGREFKCSREEALSKIELGIKIVKAEYFIPPRYAISAGAREVVLANNLTVIERFYLYSPEGMVYPILNREYTWRISKILYTYQFSRAASAYKNTKGTFFLSLHPTVVDNPEGVKFLHEFFKIVREDLG